MALRLSALRLVTAVDGAALIHHATTHVMAGLVPILHAPPLKRGWPGQGLLDSHKSQAELPFSLGVPQGGKGRKPHPSGAKPLATFAFSTPRGKIGAPPRCVNMVGLDPGIATHLLEQDVDIRFS